uniref:SMP-LTD domain-containing protein n=1 Tax=Hucho hucho TaxID=62062 RepID=A0A4W5L1M2_9TELE
MMTHNHLDPNAVFKVLCMFGGLSSKPRLCVLADSDEESSSAGSSDEEEVPPTEPQGTLGDKSTGTPPPPATDGRFLKFVDKIASSKYFQKATENEYIKKKIAEVSNMPLMLTVEVLELSGTLTVNIPPPPTDRIWYSFRVPPRLDLRVRPMLGEREVTFTHVTEWIEKKLSREFQVSLSSTCEVVPQQDIIHGTDVMI